MGRERSGRSVARGRGGRFSSTTRCRRYGVGSVGRINATLDRGSSSIDRDERDAEGQLIAGCGGTRSIAAPGGVICQGIFELLHGQKVTYCAVALLLGNICERVVLRLTHRARPPRLE